MPPLRAKLPPVPHLHLLVVTNGLQRQPAFERCGRVAGLQLDNGLGPLGQPRHVALVLIQALLLLLKGGTERGGWKKQAGGGSQRALGAPPALTRASCSRSSRRVTVTERSQVNFLRMVSWLLVRASAASLTSEKNYGEEERVRLPPRHRAGASHRTSGESIGGRGRAEEGMATGWLAEDPLQFSSYKQEGGPQHSSPPDPDDPLVSCHRCCDPVWG